VGEKARQYTLTTIKRLHALSGNQCAAIDCNNPLIARDGETIISKICHIEAASTKGARYNPNMTDDERKHFDNLILLCDECHNIIDNTENESKYPVSLLKKWKKLHENKQLDKLSKNPSLLIQAINIIADENFDDDIKIDKTEKISFEINEKILFNEIKENRSLIEEYKVFHSKINSLYKELEIQGSFKKEKLLRNIKMIYLKTKGKYISDFNDPMQSIRKNADKIMADIESELYKLAEKGNPTCSEDITFAISIIMVDAFIRCKILEGPYKK
jgi:hypothetical protein